MYRFKDILLEIPSDVFHPGFFFSTKLLMHYIESLPLDKKRFLELGCGSALISIMAAKKGASVTATDINRVAVEYLNKNMKKNGVQIEAIQSDLFKDIPREPFDIVAINPPYYKKDPVTLQDYAWYCGKNGEYFSALFSGLENYISDSTEILMVVSESCDRQMIEDFATGNGFMMHPVYSKQNLLEKNIIFKITKK